MIELIEIKSACNGVLREAFPDLKIYGPDTVEGLKRPSFYTEIVPYTLNYETVNRVKQSCGFKITLLEETPNETFELKTYASIRKAFGLKLHIGERFITVSDIDFDYAGKENNIMQMTLTLSWYDTITEAVDLPLIETVEINERTS